jgi:lysine/ornithine N-monooxygenase
MMIRNQILTLNKSFKINVNKFGNMVNFPDLYYVIKMITNKQKTKVMKNVKVSFEISNVSDETIRALQKYLYETLEFSELISSDEECSNLEIIETLNK